MDKEKKGRFSNIKGSPFSVHAILALDSLLPPPPTYVVEVQVWAMSSNKSDWHAIRKHSAQHDVYNRLHSVARDLDFVERVRSDWYGGRLPVVGERSRSITKACMVLQS